MVPTGLPLWVSFDCYGTLVDWETAVGRFLADHGAAFATWERIQFELLAPPWRPYRAILQESARRAAPRAPAERLANAFAAAPAFPDSRPALQRLRHAGLRLAVISNTDRDLIAQTLAALEVPFDAVVTSEDARAYKPNEAPFRLALRRLDVPPRCIVHVAFGFDYDLLPAARVGLRTLWLNRRGESRPPGPSPEMEARDLLQAADLILSVHGWRVQ